MGQFWYTVLCLVGGFIMGMVAVLSYITVSSIGAVKRHAEGEAEMIKTIQGMFNEPKKVKNKSKNRLVLEDDNVKIEAVKLKVPRVGKSEGPIE